MDKYCKTLNGSAINALLPCHEYTYNRKEGLIGSRWIDREGETTNYKLKVPEKLKRYLMNHYADEILAGYIMGYNKAVFDCRTEGENASN